jgi:hypothetical protein
MAANETTFKAGWSGNPGGRRKDPERFGEFREFLRTYSDEAATELLERALGRTQPDGKRDPRTGRDNMLELLLAYMWGKPAQVVAGQGGDGPAVLKVIREILDPANTDTASL